MDWLRRLAVVCGVIVAAIAVGGGLYLLVSFLVMRRYTPSRTWGRTAGAAIREAIAIAVTQPLIPFFYVLGRRMGGARDGRPIVFVHGYFQNRADFVYLAGVARRARLGPLYAFNYSWLSSIPSIAGRLATFVERVVRETGHERVAIVAHSLGGVVALEYMSSAAGAARVERCVTIASPHAGVQWRTGWVGGAARELHARSEYMRSRGGGPLPVAVVSIFSRHDNIVHPASTSALLARGGEDVPVDDLGHLGLLFSAEVADLTVRALR